MIKVDVGSDFSDSLICRNDKQGDGKYTAVEFRNKYLISLDNEGIWKEKETIICLDFSKVRTILPSFANEAFAYFLKFNISPDDIKRLIRFEGLSPVKEMIINRELTDGYKRH